MEKADENSTNPKKSIEEVLTTNNQITKEPTVLSEEFRIKNNISNIIDKDKTDEKFEKPKKKLIYLFLFIFHCILSLSFCFHCLHFIFNDHVRLFLIIYSSKFVFIYFLLLFYLNYML